MRVTLGPLVGPMLNAWYLKTGWYLPQNTRIGRSTTGALCFSQIRAGSPCDRFERVWRSREELCAVCNIIQHDWFGFGSVTIWEAYPWRATQTCILLISSYVVFIVLLFYIAIKCYIVLYFHFLFCKALRDFFICEMRYNVLYFTLLYRLGNGTLTAIRYQDEILGPIVRTLHCCSGSWLPCGAQQCMR